MKLLTLVKPIVLKTKDRYGCKYTHYSFPMLLNFKQMIECPQTGDWAERHSTYTTVEKRVKRLCRICSEFTVDPFFTIEKAKIQYTTYRGREEKEGLALVHRQFGYTLTFWPEYFGLLVDKLKDADMLKIDLTSWGIKRASDNILKKVSKLPFVKLSDN